MIFLLLVALGLVLLLSLSALRGRVGLLEAAVARAATKDEVRTQVDELQRRLSRLEAGRADSVAAFVASPVAESTPIVEPFGASDTLEVVVEADGVDVEPAPQGIEVMAAVSLEPEPAVTHVFASVTDVPPDVPEATPIVATEPMTPDKTPDSWEVVVGTSWLNKVGVLTFVTGLALLLGYSMVHVGPAGRIAMGYMLGAAMLVVGVAIERRAPYRAYGHGLVAGGWAGIYVTTFAMRAVPAAQIVESDLVGAIALLVVAGAMVAHSLRYRSQTVTALAYVAAYLPLVVTPMSSFSLVAAIPLAVSLLVVAQRFGWSGVSLLGLISTYGIFALRGHVIPGVVDGSRFLPYALLATYWITFEIADILTLRLSRATTGSRPAELFMVNAAGYLGCVLLTLPPNDPSLAAYVVASSAMAYLGSAMVRARILGKETSASENSYFTTMHGAAGLAAGLAVWAIDLRFAGPRETLALLLETELLVTSGLTLADRNIRRIGTAAAAITTLHAFSVAWQGDATMAWPWTMSVWTPVMAVLAVCWYFNREWTRQRAVAIDPVEYLYSWIASVFVGLIVRHEIAPVHWGLAGLMAAAVLLYVGTRRAGEYRQHSYVAMFASVMTITHRFAVEPSLTTKADVWVVLPVSVVLAYGYAWWVRSHATEHIKDEARVAAAFASSSATFMVAVLEWRLLPSDWLGAAWAMTAAILVAAGAWRGVGGLRWQGYALALVGAAHAAAPLMFRAPEAWTGVVSASIVIAALYATGYVGRRAATEESAVSPGAERSAAGCLPLVATALLTLLKWRALPEMAVPLGWAITALVLVGLGRWRDRAGQRWQGYAVTVLATLQTIAWTLPRIAVTKAAGDPFLLLVTAAGLVVAIGYLASYLARIRTALEHGRASSSRELEDVAALAVAAGATVTLVNLEHVWFGHALAPAAWCATAGALLWLGFARNVGDLRIHGYVMFGLAASICAASLGDRSAATVSMLMTVGLLYVASLTSRGPIRAALVRGASTAAVESRVRVASSVVATFLLTGWIGTEAPANLVTMGWGLEGIALLMAGFGIRDRALRLAGLGLLFLCILKLFLYDLRELEALGRIVSFVVLGLVLLGVSWTYTRYREEIRRFL